MLAALRAVAIALVSILLGAAGAGAQSLGPKVALHAARCPGDASLGTVVFARGGFEHTVSLATCTDRVTGKARPAPSRSRLRSRSGLVASVSVRRAPNAAFGSQAITVDGRAVHTVREDYRRAPAGSPGPLLLVGWSPDSRWLLFAVDPFGSASLAADGLELRALRVADGRVVPVGRTLLNSDYSTWCGTSLVLTAGGNRLATTGKRLVVATGPAWSPKPLWRDPARAFGSVACAPDGGSVAVLSQPANATDYEFFHTRWQLWQVGLDGSRRLLDAPPKGWADESPRWSRDGRVLLFVRERAGYGWLMLRRGGQTTGPIASLGYSLGYYGHHSWRYGASWSAGA
jgi:hypothetical protein